MKRKPIDLNKMSKNDLIAVIADMHDTVQDWDNGWGYSKEAAENLIDIGDSCVKDCQRRNDFTFNIYRQ